MLKHTATWALLLASQLAMAASTASHWVVLDVRHHHYDDRIRVVYDLDRNLPYRASFDEQSLWLSFPGTLQSMPCPTLPSPIKTAWRESGIGLRFPMDYWVHSFQLANPPRLVVDLYGRVGREVIEDALRAPTLPGQQCP